MLLYQLVHKAMWHVFISIYSNICCVLETQSIRSIPISVDSESMHVLSVECHITQCIDTDNQSFQVFVIRLDSNIAGDHSYCWSLISRAVMTGLINRIIFYASIISTSSGIVFPIESFSFLGIIVAWLNLDIGFDVCFFGGLDMYIKIWLQWLFLLNTSSHLLSQTIMGACSPGILIGPSKSFDSSFEPLFSFNMGVDMICNVGGGLDDHCAQSARKVSTQLFKTP